ncbi:Crp/Fnr family transcriptional regulator [Candidatus Latescibacterota bacterium]
MKNSNSHNNNIHPLEDIIGLLGQVPLFDLLDEGEIKVIAGYTETRPISSGKVLFNEGDRGNYVCFVVDGVLDVVKTSKTSDDVVLASLKRGRSTGEMSLIDDFPRSATIKAQTNASLLILDRARFDELLEDHSMVGIKVLKGITKLVCENLRKTSERLAGYMMPLS